MIWIFLLYVLPLIISTAGAYYFIKRDKGDVKDFIKTIPILLIPLISILAIIVGICVLVGDWIENDDNWQNFLNKKL